MSSLLIIFYSSLILAGSSNYKSAKKVLNKQKSIVHIQALKEKSDILSVKNKFIAIVTHEIRNFVAKYDVFINVIILNIVSLQTHHFSKKRKYTMKNS